jgi:hypothetical protein
MSASSCGPREQLRAYARANAGQPAATVQQRVALVLEAARRGGIGLRQRLGEPGARDGDVVLVRRAQDEAGEGRAQRAHARGPSAVAKRATSAVTPS